MAQRRELSEAQKKKDGEWLKQLLKARGLKQNQLAELMEIENEGNISHWCTGRSAIPDLDLLWLGRHFHIDPFEVRPGLTEYVQYFGGDKLLMGLPTAAQLKIIDFAEMVRRDAQVPALRTYSAKVDQPDRPAIEKQSKYTGKKQPPKKKRPPITITQHD